MQSVRDLSAEDLKEVHDNRKKIQKNTYKKIYLQVCDKILKMNKQFYVKNCTYHVPIVMWGLPLYNMEECLVYIRWRLRKKGIHTKFEYPNLLRISWEKVVDTNLSIENIANEDEENSKINGYNEELRWDHKIVQEKNERTLEQQRYREDQRRYKQEQTVIKREDREREKQQRNRQEEIEAIIQKKNHQALLAIEYGLTEEKPKKKVLLIN